MRERNQLAQLVDGVRKVERDFEDTVGLAELADAEGDQGTLDEVQTALQALALEAKRREYESLLSGEADINDAYLEVHAGAGGTESQDWAEMLLRMYVRWAERKGYKIDTLDLQPGDEAGIKGVTLAINGPYAYGYLKAEAGVHRLVRISPFDANKRRHTSF